VDESCRGITSFSTPHIRVKLCGMRSSATNMQSFLSIREREREREREERERERERSCVCVRGVIGGGQSGGEQYGQLSCSNLCVVICLGGWQ